MHMQAALLVGEPIMYPEIATFVGELHSRRISSFLVRGGGGAEVL